MHLFYLQIGCNTNIRPDVVINSPGERRSGFFPTHRADFTLHSVLDNYRDNFDIHCLVGLGFWLNRNIH
jgi:hypothetical protein